jgi:hypothetical protein
MKNTLHSYILAKLSRAASDDDVIYAVCEKSGLGWDEAKSLVEKEKEEHAGYIDFRQLPLMISLSVVFSILGIVLAIGPVIYLWNMLDVTRAFLMLFSSGTASGMDIAVKFLFNRCLLLSWFELPAIIFATMTGIGILIANVQYVRDVWRLFLRRQKWLN